MLDNGVLVAGSVLNGLCTNAVDDFANIAFALCKPSSLTAPPVIRSSLCASLKCSLNAGQIFSLVSFEHQVQISWA